VSELPALGDVGIWSSAFALAPAVAIREAAAEIEELGFGAIWVPEGFGTKESLSTAALVLSATRRVTVCTGIANIWARDPVAAATGARSLMEAFPGASCSDSESVTRSRCRRGATSSPCTPCASSLRPCCSYLTRGERLTKSSAS
jgi:hypothetical protein